MLLKIYEFIQKLQDEIGDEAEIRLAAINGILEIRVDWWVVDFHANRQFSENELRQVADESLPISHFVSWCKYEYDRKVKSKK